MALDDTEAAHAHPRVQASTKLAVASSVPLTAKQSEPPGSMRVPRRQRRRSQRSQRRRQEAADGNESPGLPLCGRTRGVNHAGEPPERRGPQPRSILCSLQRDCTEDQRGIPSAEKLLVRIVLC